MRVLFLSVTAGQGHNQAAKVVMDYLNDRNVECAMLDTFEYINPILSESIAKGYLVSTKLTPTVYGKLYRLAEKHERSDSKLSITKLTNSILSRKLVTFLREYNPDVIVCTHIFSAQIISHLKRKGLLSAKTIGIVTDFTIHPFWEETNLDCYITASELLNLQMAKKGIDIKRVKAIGIPIHTRFSEKIAASEARSILGIEDKTTVFVMSGSMGYGNVAHIIEQIDKLDMEFQIISVCGHNAALKRRIDSIKTRKKIYNFGYINNVDVMMDASNCIVSKPGGLTVSESLAKGLPMIMINPIPGQEDRNVEFLLNNGVGMKISSTFPIDEALYQILYDGWRLNHMKEAINHLARPHSAKELGELIMQMASEA